MKTMMVDADSPESMFLSFNRDFWMFEQSVSLLEAMQNAVEGDAENLLNLYWFMSNINEALVRGKGCAVIVS